MAVRDGKQRSAEREDGSTQSTGKNGSAGLSVEEEAPEAFREVDGLWPDEEWVDEASVGQKLRKPTPKKG